MDSEQPVQIGRWQSRILRAALPCGVLLLLLWVARVFLALIVGVKDFEVGWASAAMGLILSLVLIASGYAYRRNLAAR
jgi:hypothetical protein